MWCLRTVPTRQSPFTHLLSGQPGMDVTLSGEDVVEAAWHVAVKDVLPELWEPGVDVVRTRPLLQQTGAEGALDGRVNVCVVHLHREQRSMTTTLVKSTSLVQLVRPLFSVLSLIRLQIRSCFCPSWYLCLFPQMFLENLSLFENLFSYVALRYVRARARACVCVSVWVRACLRACAPWIFVVSMCV